MNSAGQPRAPQAGLKASCLTLSNLLSQSDQRIRYPVGKRSERQRPNGPTSRTYNHPQPVTCSPALLDRLRAAAKLVPDADATATRGAIQAAMLKGGKPRPEAPPDYSHMTDGEFRETVKKDHGYTPL